MEFSFSEDQDELRRAARRFLAVASSEERVRSVMETEQGYDSTTWERLSEELAWTALTIPEEYGGLGMSYLDLHPLMEEMGRSLLCSPFFSTICLGANALMLGG
ncbi:MAG: acyl-CoA dehydrogenase family protein, partial [Deltaproteobacteria bacterium]|nr:acyl-CoA dehydrogenase family protein [Deltaproteobacteria bacterium]